MVKIPSFNIIPKPKETEPVWLAAVFWSLLGVLLLLIVPILIFQRQTAVLGGQRVALEAERAQIIQNNVGLNQRMALVFRRLNNFSQLLKNHRFNSNIFAFLSAICHSRVQFTGFSIDEKGDRLNLGVKTENFKTLGEQLLILKSNPQVSGANFSGLSIDREGKIICSLSFNLDPKIITPAEGL